MPRGASLGSSTMPATPSTTPFVTMSSSTRCRNLNSRRPASAAARTRFSNGSTMPGPVPQVTWNRGTELPGPVARAPPRSAQPTIGRDAVAHLAPARTASRRRPTRRTRAPTAWAVRLPAGRTPPVLSQSCQASSRSSRTRSRRCSGEFTKNSPPNDHQAWPPSDCSGSWSSSSTRRPASAASAAAASPASPAPTTITSASMTGPPLSRTQPSDERYPPVTPPEAVLHCAAVARIWRAGARILKSRTAVLPYPRRERRRSRSDKTW